ncbi:28S ribosomal protein S14, mitochondrial-like [Lytechinus variegatus]|uniref:28S ribosomal protein S14, mitochondrial-like n=1 Tax=Lytechinus variegatus TaxID=7654 RepID=UPI001BB24983|nr:28S ribosomal protein S14, mitochondrial-like [Lytechinus variegatus]
MESVLRICSNSLRGTLCRFHILSNSHSCSNPLNAVGAMLTRSYYADWKMIRDVKRRRLVKEHHRDRLRINCIRKNTILPDEIREVADQEIASFPRDSCHVRIRDRCAITSRPRSVLKKWRLSRIVWRSIADIGNMSGAQRSTW